MNSEEDEFKRIELEAKRRDLQAQPVAYLLAYLCENRVGHRYFRWKKPSDIYKPIGLYTTPPQRPWVGLTDDEIEKMRHLIDWTAHWSYGKLAKAIEAKLKEKNT